MTVQTTASTPIVNMMKEDLAEKIFVHMNLASPELQIFALKTRQLNGKYYRVNFQVAGNSRLEARPEDDWLPGQSPLNNLQDKIAPLDIQEMHFFRRSVYSAVDFTGQMAAAVKSKEGGYENIMEYRFKDTEKFLEERVGVHIAYSACGVLGKIKSMNKATGVVTLYEQSSAAGGNPAVPEVGNRLIRPGMVMDAVASRWGAIRSGNANDRARRVTARSIDNSAPTVTFNDSGAGTDLTGNNWANDDYLISYNTRAASAITDTTSAKNNLYAPWGMLDAVDDGSLGNNYYGDIDRTSYESLMCQRLGNAGGLRAISLDLINLGCEQSEVRAAGKPDVIYCTPHIRRKLVAFLTATVVTTAAAGLASENPTRYNNPGAEKVTIGLNTFDVLTLGPTGRLTVASSRLAPHHMVLLLQRDTALLMQDSAPTFIDNDGLKVRIVDGKDSFQSIWRWYVPGVIMREAWKNVRIDDVSGDILS